MIPSLNNSVILVEDVNPNDYFLKSLPLKGRLHTSSSICHSKGEVSLTGSRVQWTAQSNEAAGRPAFADGNRKRVGKTIGKILDQFWC